MEIVPLVPIILCQIFTGKFSIVDCISSETMRLFGIITSIYLDRHFKEQGFNCLPE